MSSLSGVRRPETDFVILKATERLFLYQYDKIWGTICISVPHSKFWGTFPSVHPPVIYAHAFAANNRRRLRRKALCFPDVRLLTLSRDSTVAVDGFEWNLAQIFTTRVDALLKKFSRLSFKGRGHSEMKCTFPGGATSAATRHILWALNTSKYPSPCGRSRNLQAPLSVRQMCSLRFDDVTSILTCFFLNSEADNFPIHR